MCEKEADREEITTAYRVNAAKNEQSMWDVSVAMARDGPTGRREEAAVVCLDAGCFVPFPLASPEQLSSSLSKYENHDTQRQDESSSV